MPVIFQCVVIAVLFLSFCWFSLPSLWWASLICVRYHCTCVQCTGRTTAACASTHCLTWWCALTSLTPSLRRLPTVVSWIQWGLFSLYLCGNRLVGLVVRRPPRERKVPGSHPACGGIFSGSSHTSDLNIGTPVATLPGAWRYRVSAGTGRPGVSILWLGEMESWICNFYLSVAARKIVWADPSLRYTCMLLGR